MQAHEQSTSTPDVAYFELGRYRYPAFDVAAPERAIEDEQHRLTTTPLFTFQLARAHAFTPGADDGTLYTKALVAMDTEAQRIMDSCDEGRTLHCSAAERKFMTSFLDLEDASDKVILERWGEREHFFALAMYAATFGLTFDEANRDIETERAPDPRYTFKHPRYLTALRRQVDSGRNPELSLWQRRVRWILDLNVSTEL